MWKLLGWDETCAFPEEYNEYKTKTKAKEGFKEEYNNWMKCRYGNSKPKAESFSKDGIEGKHIVFSNYDYYLWIEQTK